MNFKSGFIALIGRPNVGKSSLLNELVGGKVSIVTSKAQTTRDNIRGILTKKDEYQMVFVDTPGVHNSKSELDRVMNASAFKTMKDVDLILFLVPANEKIGRNDLFLLEQLKQKELPKFLLVTKSDAVSQNELIIKLGE
jgi:GTPase